MGNEVCPEEPQGTPDHLFARLRIEGTVTASPQVCLLESAGLSLVQEHWTWSQGRPRAKSRDIQLSLDDAGAPTRLVSDPANLCLAGLRTAIFRARFRVLSLGWIPCRLIEQESIMKEWDRIIGGLNARIPWKPLLFRQKESSLPYSNGLCGRVCGSCRAGYMSLEFTVSMVQTSGTAADKTEHQIT